MNLQEWNNISIQSRLFRIITFTIGRLGVPIFLFISGYFLLNRKYEKDDDIKNFYKKKLLPLVLVSEIWIIIYNIFITIYFQKPFDIYVLVKEMFFIEKVPLINMWYMPMIIGIYIVIPYLSKILDTFSIKIMKIPIILVLFINFMLPTMNIILKTFNLAQYGCKIDVTFLGGTYGIYVLLGYFISKGILKKIDTKLILCVSIINFLLACLMQFFEYYKGIEYNIWYDSPFIFICTLNLFELFTRINIKEINKSIEKIYIYISKISLGIYFIHIIIGMLFSQYVNKMQVTHIKVSMPLKVFSIFLLMFNISIILIFILSKLKVVKEKVFLIK